MFDPLQLCRIFQPIGNDLDGAVVKAFEGAAYGHHFFCRGVGAGDDSAALVHMSVEARRGEAERAGFQCCSRKLLHGCGVGRCCVVVAALTHYVVAQRHVWHLCADVHDVGCVDAVEVLLEGFPTPGHTFVQRCTRDVFHAFHERNECAFLARPHRRKADAAIAHHDRGHAMPATGCERLVPAHLAVVMRVDVNEPRCEQVATCVDDPTRIGRPTCAGPPAPRNDRGDGRAINDNTAVECRRAAAIDDARVTDDQVVHGVLLGGGRMSGLLGKPKLPQCRRRVNR